MRATAMACPAALVTITRHCAAGSAWAAWASRRAWAPVIGPIRPSVPGRSVSPARVVQGSSASSSPGLGRPSAGQAGRASPGGIAPSSGQAGTGPVDVVILLSRIPGRILRARAIIVQAVVRRRILIARGGSLVPQAGVVLARAAVVGVLRLRVAVGVGGAVGDVLV